MKQKPNILWIITDQQSYNMLGCMGNSFVHTPNLNALARQSRIFENTYCTNPVCLPSRFSLFNGIYPGEIGIRSNEFQDESTGMPEILLKNGLGKLLKDQGYQAVYGGKEHLPFCTAKDIGFDYICSDERQLLADTCAQFLLNYDSPMPFSMVASFINPHDICLMAISDFFEEETKHEAEFFAKYFSDAITHVSQAIKMPEGIDEDTFFRKICPPLPLNYLPAEDEPEAIAMLMTQRRFKMLARQNYTDNRWRLHRWAYANLTEQVDRQIGVVLDALKISGRYEDTVILFTSDHGDMDASHKMEHKEALYQEACRVPLMIKGVGNGKAVRDVRMVCNGLDVISTIMDYAGIEKPDYIQGYSLKPAVECSNDKSRRDIVILESGFGIGAVSSKYKYVIYDHGKNREQFYDLDINPGEMYNQIDDKQYAKDVEILRAAVKMHILNRNPLFLTKKRKPSSV